MEETKNNILRSKSFLFAVRIVNLYKKLSEEKKEFVLSKQILRSGTSVGANIREANNGESRADFIHKLSIALKEIDETIYWLELLKETSYLAEGEFEPLHAESIDIIKLLKRSILTAKSNL